MLVAVYAVDVTKAMAALAVDYFIFLFYSNMGFLSPLYILYFSSIFFFSHFSPFSSHFFSTPQPILPPVQPRDKGKLCLVLDLDETLVHSSFRAVPNPDYIIPVQIEDTVHHVYVCKRPGVDEYLRRCGEKYEVIIYTASLNKYADPLLDKLDVHKVIRHRLFRESCTQYQGNFVKNLSLLGRDLTSCVIVDNSPLSYLFHPENAVGCISWIDQQDDDELRVIQVSVGIISLNRVIVFFLKLQLRIL